jgi:predicted HTH transcriptional regulator
MLADIDEAHLWSYVKEFEGDAFDEASVVGYPTKDVLERDLLLAVNAGSETIPTVAALLLFGRDERVAELLPRSQIVATRFAGDTTKSPVIERAQLTGNLHTLYESALSFISRYCDLWDEKPRRFPASEVGDAPVLARANYHRGAVGEGVANALVHRDLALRDFVTRIHIFDRSIEVINPRRSVGFAPAAQKAIRYGVPQRLNPQLTSIFYSTAYGLNLTRRGSLPELLRHSRLFSGRRAEIFAFNDEFRLRFYGV